MKFLDEAKIFVKSGGGGNGCVGFRREANVEFGGPDGGDGGRGGDVAAVSVEGLNTLIDFRYRQHFKAGRGGHGSGRGRTGASGQTLTIKVPIGTQILAEDRDVLLADLTRSGQRAVLASGGDGGFGKHPLQVVDQPRAQARRSGQLRRGMRVLAAAQADRRRRPGGSAQRRQVHTAGRRHPGPGPRSRTILSPRCTRVSAWPGWTTQSSSSPTSPA